MQFVIAAVLLVGAYILTSIFKPHLKPANFSQFTTPQSAEGTPQTVIFGDVWLDDWMVLWFGNYRSTPIYGGSKGGK